MLADLKPPPATYYPAIAGEGGMTETLRRFAFIRRTLPFRLLEKVATTAPEALTAPLDHWDALHAAAEDIGAATETLPELIERGRRFQTLGQVLTAVEALDDEALASCFSAETFDVRYWSVLRNLPWNLETASRSALMAASRGAISRALVGGNVYGAAQLAYLVGLITGGVGSAILEESLKATDYGDDLLTLGSIAQIRAIAGDTRDLNRLLHRLEADPIARVAVRTILSRYYRCMIGRPPLLRSYLSARPSQFPYDLEPAAWGEFFDTVAGLLTRERGRISLAPETNGKHLLYLSASVRREPEFNAEVAHRLTVSGRFEVVLPQDFTPRIPHEKLGRHIVAMCDVAMDRCDGLLLLADVYGRDCASEVRQVYDQAKPIIAYVERDGYVAEDWMILARIDRVITPSVTAYERLVGTAMFKEDQGHVRLIGGPEELPAAVLDALAARTTGAFRSHAA